MSAIEIVTTKLQAASAVTAITTRAGIYPVMVPQNARPPFVILDLVSGRDEHLLAGAGQYYLHRVSVACCATTATGALALGDAVLAALQDVIKETVGSYRDVDVSFAETDMTDHSDDRSIVRRLMHFRVRWRRAP